MGNVVVVGSVNVDFVVTVEHLPQEGQTVSGGSFERFGGGKGANQAVAAARAASAPAWRRASRPKSAGSPSPSRIKLAGEPPGRSRVMVWPDLPSKRRR